MRALVSRFRSRRRTCLRLNFVAGGHAQFSRFSANSTGLQPLPAGVESLPKPLRFARRGEPPAPAPVKSAGMRRKAPADGAAPGMMKGYCDSLFSLEGRTAVVIGGTGELCGMMAEGLAAAGAQVVLVGRDATKAESRLGPHRSVRMEGLGSPPTLAYRRERGDPGLQEVRQGSAPCQSGLGYQGLCLRRERLPAIRLPHRDPQRPLLIRRPVVSTLTSLASLFVRSALIQRSKFAGTGFEG